ncbi:MAG: hypothetical protein J6J60_03095 [Clostridia bacterium]|nr:hypothetical protein [Clostridia bacterium]
MTKQYIRDIVNSRPVKPTEEQLKNLFSELQRWTDGTDSIKLTLSDSEYRAEYQAMLEKLLSETDINNVDSVFIALEFLWTDNSFEMIELPKAGLFSNKEFMLHDSNREYDENELFWDTYLLSTGPISYEDAVKLTKANGDIFLSWFSDRILPGKNEIVENRRKFSEFIKNSEWNFWAEDIAWKLENSK